MKNFIFISSRFSLSHCLGVGGEGYCCIKKALVGEYSAFDGIRRNLKKMQQGLFQTLVLSQPISVRSKRTQSIPFTKGTFANNGNGKSTHILISSNSHSYVLNSLRIVPKPTIKPNS